MRNHLRFAQPRSLRRRISDEFTVPVCRVHHRELHRQGDEAAWWRRIKIDPLPIAHRLWRRARFDGPTKAANGEPEPSVASAANGVASTNPGPTDSGSLVSVRAPGPGRP
jgi:hypothetical protein